MNNCITPLVWRRRRLPVGKEGSISGLQSQMNRLVNDFFSGSSLIPEFISEPISQLGEKVTAFVPNVNVVRSDKEWVVTAELPGMDEKDIELSLTKEALTIRGEKKNSYEDKSDGVYHYLESSYGSFERIVPLSDEVEEDKVDASFAKGVLTIKLPKRAASQNTTKKVSIRSAS